MDSAQVSSLKEYIEKGIQKVNDSLPNYMKFLGRKYSSEHIDFTTGIPKAETNSFSITLKTERNNFFEGWFVNKDNLLSIDVTTNVPKLSFNLKAYEESPEAFKKIMRLTPLMYQLHEFSTKVIPISGLESVIGKFDTQNS